MKIDDIVAAYVKLRDQKAQIKAEYEGKVAGIESLMERTENALLGAFNAAGIESVKTPFGTAYCTTRTSASVGDRDAFLGHIRENGLYELLDCRANKTAIEQYKNANGGALPPGVKWNEERVVNVRRS